MFDFFFCRSVLPLLRVGNADGAKGIHVFKVGDARRPFKITIYSATSWRCCRSVRARQRSCNQYVLRPAAFCALQPRFKITHPVCNDLLPTKDCRRFTCWNLYPQSYDNTVVEIIDPINLLRNIFLQESNCRKY